MRKCEKFENTFAQGRENKMFGAEVSGFWMMAGIPRNVQWIQAQHVEAESLLNENMDTQKGSMKGRKGLVGRNRLLGRQTA